MCSTAPVCPAKCRHYTRDMLMIVSDVEDVDSYNLYTCNIRNVERKHSVHHVKASGLLLLLVTAAYSLLFRNN
jgi:hypothetical protein